MQHTIDSQGSSAVRTSPFSDASVSGYRVCSYLRAVSKSGEVHCTLVMGKARVAPKVTTIPRLELSAAVVATRTSNLLKREMELESATELLLDRFQGRPWLH